MMGRMPTDGSCFHILRLAQTFSKFERPRTIINFPTPTTKHLLLIHNMARTLSFLLSSLVLLSLMGEAQSLASLIFNIRQNAVWGVLGRGTNGLPNSNSVQSPSTISIATTSFSVTPDVAGFDPDEYRREITDLVYQRNLQRFSS